jgi:hypothetical protein
MDKHQARAATGREQEEVRRLREAGVSIRRIAEQVFGDRRYRGRVERILQRPVEPGPDAERSLEEIDLDRIDSAALLRLLFERRLRSWALSGRAPSMSELRTALDVRRQLETLESLERIRAMTTSVREEASA